MWRFTRESLATKNEKNTKNSKYSTPSRFNPVPENSCRYQLQIEPELPKRDKT
jgi:hypothetical protein